MAKIIKKLKMKQQDETMSDYIPIGAEASNVNVDGESVENKLNKTPYYYNSVADMKADTKLKVGDMAITLGYYEANDGGNGEYKIVSGSYTDDGGSYHRLNNNLFAELIIKDGKINCKQFGVSINKQNNSENINTFFNFTSTKFIVAEFIQGTYKITEQIIMPTTLHLQLKGRIIIEDYIEDAENASFILQDTGYHGYNSAFIDNSNGYLIIENKILNISKTCLELGGIDFHTNVRGLAIRYYDKGIYIKVTNFYVTNFEDCIFTGNNVAVYFEDRSTVYNTGENINFIKNTFTQNNCALYLGAPLSITVLNTSIDFNGIVFLMAQHSKINCDHCWLEGFGMVNKQPADYNGYKGIAKSITNNDFYYQNCDLIISNSVIYYSVDIEKPIMISGNNLNISLLNNWFYLYGNYTKHCVYNNNSFNLMFLCDSTVRNVIINNNRCEGTSMPFFAKKLSLISESFLDSAEISSSTLSNLSNIRIGNYYDLLNVGTGNSCEIDIVVENGYNTIKLTPVNGQSCKVDLRYKNFIPMWKIKKYIRSLAYMKGYKNATNSYIQVDIEYYDENYQLITREHNNDTAYSNDVNNTTWFGFAKETFGQRTGWESWAENSFPEQTAYIKPVFRLVAFDAATVPPEADLINSPVYFTGFYLFTE